MRKQKTVQAALAAAREYIEDPNRWCQGDLAVSRSGRQVAEDSRSAYRFCSMGIVIAVSDNVDLTNSVFALLQKAANEVGSVGVITLNDRLGHEAVVRMFRRAEELAAGGSS